jgi:hypothetical protein
VSHCPLCSPIQEAVEKERAALELLLDSLFLGGYSQFPPGPGEGVREEDWAEMSCRRDEFERARTRRIRADNRFFDACPRCHFDLRQARRELDLSRDEVPGLKHEVRHDPPRMRATGS